MSIFRLYNQNRILFWTIIIAIVVFVFIIHTINSIVANNNNNKIQNTIIDEKLYENKISIEEQISDEQVEQKEELIIDQFIRYCNAKNTQSAYDLLTEECKEEVFPTIESFENNYLKLNFNKQKLYSTELYKGNTYKVTLYENMLSTGNINNEIIQDYYTIIKQDKKIKLNISNYVERKKTNRVTENTSLKIEVEKRDVYMEYEIYQLKVTNLTENTIMLDSKRNTKTMYLLDENDTEYYAAGHEILDNNLIVKPKATNTIKIKYTKEYKSNTSRKIVFEDVILNYIENTNINEYQRNTMKVNV